MTELKLLWKTKIDVQFFLKATSSSHHNRASSSSSSSSTFFDIGRCYNFFPKLLLNFVVKEELIVIALQYFLFLFLDTFAKANKHSMQF